MSSSFDEKQYLKEMGATDVEYSVILDSYIVKYKDETHLIPRGKALMKMPSIIRQAVVKTPSVEELEEHGMKVYSAHVKWNMKEVSGLHNFYDAMFNHDTINVRLWDYRNCNKLVTYTVKLPPNYPFAAPVIKRNDKIVPFDVSDWRPGWLATKLILTIESGVMEMSAECESIFD
jgi:hypothetical protein